MSGSVVPGARAPEAVVIAIREARFPADADVVRALFREYAAGLSVDLAFQDLEGELAGLPGRYAAPRGRVLLAERQAADAAAALGCIAMRPIDTETVEMKRLFVRPEGRGAQLGRRLIAALTAAAVSEGYRRMRLDTLPEMQAARGLYASLGFVPIAPYVFNPVEGTAYMERDLSRAEPTTFPS